MSSTNPRRFLLKTLFAADGQPLTARELVAAGEVLGFTPNSLRVALVRLAAEGLVTSLERGVYGLGIEAAPLAEDAQHWRAGEQRVRPWNGDWIVVYTGALARTERTAIRRRERALQLLGLAESARGLHVRPDNLAGGVSAVRMRLRQLGLEESASVMTAREFEAAEDARLRKLWDGRALVRGYQRTREQLETLMARAGKMELESAAREFYRAGDKAIRMLIYDPLLPQPLVDVDARAAFTDTVLRFDATGHRLWRELGMTNLPAVAPSALKLRAH